MKKLWALVLAAVMTATLLTACDNDTVTPPDDGIGVTGSDGTGTGTPDSPGPNDVVAVYPYADIHEGYSEVVIDGGNVSRNIATRIMPSGIGVSPREIQLLLDYKRQNPEAYQYIISLLFGAKGSIGFSHLALEVDGTESDELMRFGYAFAKDALAANGGLTFQLTFSDISSDLSAKYSAISKILTDFKTNTGAEINYVLSDLSTYPAEWLSLLKAELSSEYPDIKIIASDSNNLLELIKNDITLLDAVDVISVSEVSEVALELQNKYNKEVWSYIDVSNLPRENNVSVDLIAFAVKQSNLSGASRAVFGSAITADYQNYGFITANDPWSGHFDMDIGLWTAANLSLLVGHEMYPIKIPDYIQTDDTAQIMAFANTTTGDYTLVVANNTPKTQKLTFTALNMQKGEALLHRWDTYLPEDASDDYDYFFQQVDEFYPVEYALGKYVPDEPEPTDEEDDENDLLIVADVEGEFSINTDNVITYPSEDDSDVMAPYSYSMEFVPYSATTISTLNIYDNAVDSWQVYSDVPDRAPLAFSYIDDFGNGYAKAQNLVCYSGAMEVRGGKLTATDANSDSLAMLGDQNWRDYQLSSNFQFGGDTDNYILYGVRANQYPDITRAESGYFIKIFGSGRWELLCGREVKQSGNATLKSDWNNVNISIIGNEYFCTLNDDVIAHFVDENGVYLAGRVAIGASYKTEVDDISIVSIENGTDYISTLPALDVIPSGSGWRVTTTKGIIGLEASQNAATEFKFDGQQFALVGENPTGGQIRVTVDDVVYDEIAISKTEGFASVFTSDRFGFGSHRVNIEVISGQISFDTVYIF